VRGKPVIEIKNASKILKSNLVEEKDGDERLTLTSMYRKLLRKM
jgi:hypothetical protein